PRCDKKALHRRSSFCANYFARCNCEPPSTRFLPRRQNPTTNTTSVPVSPARSSSCANLAPYSTIAPACFTIDQMSRLPFIAFEGSEGSGKSTQVRRLASHLERSGVPFLVTREPGGPPIGESIRELLQFAPHNAGMTPETELLLFEASRSQLVREIIKPGLERAVSVIADRFFDSTTVYQGAARR